LWLDGFRGLAVLLMIETHVVNTFLAQSRRDPAWFAWLDYVNGLVAPSFLFIAGTALGLAMRRGLGKPVEIVHKVRRLSEILVIGYLLHFPFNELHGHRWHEALLVGSQMDVLQCIAISLAVGSLVEWLAQHAPGNWRRPFWTAALLILAAGIVLTAPVLETWKGGLTVVTACLNQTTGSLFPLLPWAAFVFAGALRGSAEKQTRWRVLLAIAAGVSAAWWRGSHPFSPASPAFFVERLAWVLLLEEACQAANFWEGRKWIRFAGRESLLIYVAHLVLISFLEGLGVRDLGFAGVIGMLAFVLASVFAIARLKQWGWAKFKSK